MSSNSRHFSCGKKQFCKTGNVLNAGNLQKGFSAEGSAADPKRATQLTESTNRATHAYCQGLSSTDILARNCWYLGSSRNAPPLSLRD